MYDQISSKLIPALKQQAGFHSHCAYNQGGSLVVSEIWDSAEQHTAWFDTNVRPNMPPDASPQIETVDLHNFAAA